MDYFRGTLKQLTLCTFSYIQRFIVTSLGLMDVRRKMFHNLIMITDFHN